MNLDKILNKIITSSFPELMGEDIQISWESIDDSLMVQGRLSEEGFYIEVDDSLKNSSNSVIIGGIAHELCHIVVSKGLTLKERRIDSLLYRLSKRYRTMDERNTDLQAIIRGFGKELLEFMEYSESAGFDYYKEDGLSFREIKSIV